MSKIHQKGNLFISKKTNDNANVEKKEKEKKHQKHK